MSRLSILRCVLVQPLTVVLCFGQRVRAVTVHPARMTTHAARMPGPASHSAAVVENHVVTCNEAHH